MATSSDTETLPRVVTHCDGERGIDIEAFDLEEAELSFDMWERYYLNAPDWIPASGITLQLIACDGSVIREVTFP